MQESAILKEIAKKRIIVTFKLRLTFVRLFFFSFYTIID